MQLLGPKPRFHTSSLTHCLDCLVLRKILRHAICFERCGCGRRGTLPFMLWFRSSWWRFMLLGLKGKPKHMVSYKLPCVGALRLECSTLLGLPSVCSIPSSRALQASACSHATISVDALLSRRQLHFAVDRFEESSRVARRACDDFCARVALLSFILPFACCLGGGGEGCVFGDQDCRYRFWRRVNIPVAIQVSLELSV